MAAQSAGFRCEGGWQCVRKADRTRDLPVLARGRTSVGAVKEFDVVVVGGGAAGCVVAARLAESPSRSVLLLEAGPDLRGGVPDDLRDGWSIKRDLPGWGY